MPETRVPENLRREVIERASGCCEYCQSQVIFSPDPFCIEHVIPRSRGGLTAAQNLALSCQGCNGHKHNATEHEDPVTRQIARLFHPRLDQWSDHFAWEADFTFIEGVTPVGRATVEALHLNREWLINLRRVLHAMGEHPPKLGVDLFTP
jgi:hypothetical protein